MSTIPMQVLVKGRLVLARRHENKIYSHVLIAAADQWSSPGTVEIRSTSPLGAKGEDVEALCLLGGFRRKPFAATDKQTGVITKVIPVDNTLDLIEA